MFSFCSPLFLCTGNRLREPQTVRGWRSALVITLTAILLATSLGVAAGQMFDLGTDRPQHPKLHFRFFDLLSLEATPPPQEKGLIRIDEDGRTTEGRGNPIPNMKIPNQDFSHDLSLRHQNILQLSMGNDSFSEIFKSYPRLGAIRRVSDPSSYQSVQRDCAPIS